MNHIIDTLPMPTDEPITHDEIRLFDLGDLRAVNGDFNNTPANGLAVIATNPKGDKNLLVYPNDGKAPYFATAYKNHAISIGKGDIVMAVLGIDNAYTLSQQTLGDKAIQVLTLPDNLAIHFERMVKAHKPQYAFTTHDKPLNAGVNVVSLSAPLSIALSNQCLDDIFINADTAHIDDEWGELLPLSDNTKRDNPYPVQAFGTLSDVVDSIATYAQTPISMAGQAVLGALSTIGQGMVNAPMGYEYKPTSLFLLTQAESGAGKTQVSRLAYRAIYEHDRQLYEYFMEMLKEWRDNKASMKPKEWREYTQVTPEPINPTTTLTDATIERILDRFIIDGIKNQSWVSSEAGQFFGGFSLKADTKENALSSLTSLWSEGKAERLRSTRGANPILKTTAHDCRLTLDLAGQEVILKEVINDPLLNGQGLLARCLLSCEPSLIGYRDWITERDPNQDPILIDFWDRCREILESDFKADNQRVNMPFAKGAKQTLAQYQQDIEHAQRVRGKFELWRAFASRMAENATRIATLFAFYDGKTALSSDYLERAFLLVEYAINERLNYGKNEVTDTQILLDWIKAKGGYIAYSVCQSQVTPKRFRAKAVFETLINALIETNHAKIIDDDGKRFIKLNPNL